MATYPISSTPEEEIDFKVDDGKFALVRRVKRLGSIGYICPLIISTDTIILNKRELMALYQAIQEEILGRVSNGCVH